MNSREKFEKWLKTEHQLTVDDLRAGKGYNGLYDAFSLGEIFRAFQAGRQSMHDEMTEDLTDEKIDHRFICPKCGSTDVKLAPVYGSVSRCQKCKHKWANP